MGRRFDSLFTVEVWDEYDCWQRYTWIIILPYATTNSKIAEGNISETTKNDIHAADRWVLEIYLDIQQAAGCFELRKADFRKQQQPPVL